MAKRRKTKKKSAPSGPSHKLPAGFWQQVLALALIAFSLLLVVAWFGVGGPVLEWIQRTALEFIGYTIYVVPFLFIYVGVEIFRAEQNKLPLVMKFATVLFVVWFAGIFGLGDNGGWVGEQVNTPMLAMVDRPIAAFIYILLILVTILFLFRASPITIIKRIWAMMQTEKFDDNNVKVMRQAAEVEDKKKPMADFKLNAGVETLDPSMLEDDKKPSRLSSFKGSVKQDKSAEERSALVSVSDPNWKAPSVDLLEKKQSPANAGDVQQNAQIIKDTLSEFSIDVEMEGANIGPKVTQYTLSPPSGVKLTKITALETNIALNLAAQSIRIEAPIPGRRAVGIEVPNKKAADVRLYGILTSKQWQGDSEPLAFAIGRDIATTSHHLYQCPPRQPT